MVVSPLICQVLRTGQVKVQPGQQEVICSRKGEQARSCVLGLVCSIRAEARLHSQSSTATARMSSAHRIVSWPLTTTLISSRRRLGSINLKSADTEAEN